MTKEQTQIMKKELIDKLVNDLDSRIEVALILKLMRQVKEEMKREIN